MKNLFLSLIVIALLTTLGCSSCKKETPNPNNLPPITQTGSNTLGFILNGQPWKPQGHFGSTSNLSIDYDPGFKNGIFSIAAYRLTSGGDISYFGMALFPKCLFINYHPLPKFRLRHFVAFGLG